MKNWIIVIVVIALLTAQYWLFKLTDNPYIVWPVCILAGLLELGALFGDAKTIFGFDQEKKIDDSKRINKSPQLPTRNPNAMTSTPRPRFQMHLSTAIILMFTAGGLIWANTTAKLYSSRDSMGGVGPHYFAYGWPTESTLIFLPENAFNSKGSHTDLTCLMVNFFVFCVVLFAVWFLCEWLIRRHLELISQEETNQNRNH